MSSVLVMVVVLVYHSYWLWCVGYWWYRIRWWQLLLVYLQWSFVMVCTVLVVLIVQLLRDCWLYIESSPLLLYAPSNVCCHQQDTSVLLFSQ